MCGIRTFQKGVSISQAGMAQSGSDGIALLGKHLFADQQRLGSKQATRRRDWSRGRMMTDIQSKK